MNARTAGRRCYSLASIACEPDWQRFARPSGRRSIGCWWELGSGAARLALEIEGSARLTSAKDGQSLSTIAAARSTYLNDRAASIYAGTNEIQRDIVARSFLARHPN